MPSLRRLLILVNRPSRGKTVNHLPGAQAMVCLIWRRTVVLALSFALACSIAFPGTYCKTPEKEVTVDYNLLVPVRPMRVINFPTEYSMGRIKIIPNGKRSDQVPTFIPARGKVIVPAACCTIFEAEYNFFQHPELIKTFDPDAFDQIKLKIASFDVEDDLALDKAVAKLVHLTGLRAVNFERTNVSDAGIETLAALPHLSFLTLSNTRVNGSCLKKLANGNRLRTLNLDQDDLGEDNLKYIAGQQNLYLLMLSHDHLHNSSIACVSACRNLQTLFMDDNPLLTDDCIKDLLKLKELSSLRVAGTRISLKGLTRFKGSKLADLEISGGTIDKSDLAALKKALPHTFIRYGGGKMQDDAVDPSLFSPLH